MHPPQWKQRPTIMNVKNAKIAEHASHCHSVVNWWTAPDITCAQPATGLLQGLSQHLQCLDWSHLDHRSIDGCLHGYCLTINQANCVIFICPTLEQLLYLLSHVTAVLCKLCFLIFLSILLLSCTIFDNDAGGRMYQLQHVQLLKTLQPHPCLGSMEAFLQLWRQRPGNISFAPGL